MEVDKPSLKARFSAFFLRDKVPFAQKADINWSRVRNCLLAAVGLALLVVFVLPTPKPVETTFHEKLESGSNANSIADRSSDPNDDTLRTMGSGRGAWSPPASGGSHGGGEVDRAAPMILSRSGGDSKTQMPPGARIAVHLKEKATVTSRGMPVIALVSRDFVQEDALAVPAGSKLMGTAMLDAGGDRAQIEWQAIQLPDGHTRQLAAAGVGLDGQLGVPGNAHSNVAENMVGATLSRFIGAYAEGAMERESFGGNPGGASNGWKNAVVETAKDRADAFAEGLKKEKRWLELSPADEFFAVLTAAFTFRDPGGSGGR